jgi:hypothetical protein
MNHDYNHNYITNFTTLLQRTTPTLDFSQFSENLTDDLLKSALTKTGAHLHHLHLQNCTKLTDAALLDIAALCPHLKTLDLTGTHFSALQHETKKPCTKNIVSPLSFPELVTLHLDNNTYLTEIFIHAPLLETLTANNCPLLVSTKTYSKQLTRLSLENCSQIPHKEIREQYPFFNEWLITQSGEVIFFFVEKFKQMLFESNIDSRNLPLPVISEWCNTLENESRWQAAAIKEWLAILKNRLIDEGVRVRAATALGNLGVYATMEIAAALLAAKTDPQVRVRQAVLEAMSKLVSNSCTPFEITSHILSELQNLIKRNSGLHADPVAIQKQIGLKHAASVRNAVKLSDDLTQDDNEKSIEELLATSERWWSHKAAQRKEAITTLDHLFSGTNFISRILKKFLAALETFREENPAPIPLPKEFPSVRFLDPEPRDVRLPSITDSERVESRDKRLPSMSDSEKTVGSVPASLESPVILETTLPPPHSSPVNPIEAREMEQELTLPTLQLDHASNRFNLFPPVQAEAGIGAENAALDKVDLDKSEIGCLLESNSGRMESPVSPAP